MQSSTDLQHALIGLWFFIILAWILIGVVIGLFTSNVAKHKGCSDLAWFFGGFFFGPIALMAIAGMPVRSRKDNKKTLEVSGSFKLEPPPGTRGNYSVTDRTVIEYAKSLGISPRAAVVELNKQLRQKREGEQP